MLDVDALRAEQASRILDLIDGLLGEDSILIYRSHVAPTVGRTIVMAGGGELRGVGTSVRDALSQLLQAKDMQNV